MTIISDTREQSDDFFSQFWKFELNEILFYTNMWFFFKRNGIRYRANIFYTDKINLNIAQTESINLFDTQRQKLKFLSRFRKS